MHLFLDLFIGFGFIFKSNQDCKNALPAGAVSGSCNLNGAPFQLPSPAPSTDVPVAISNPLIVGASSAGAPVSPLPFQYYGSPVVTSVSPQSSPILYSISFYINALANTTAAGGGEAVPLYLIFNVSGAGCRMDQCTVVGCETAGPNCKCSSGPRSIGSEIGQLMMINETTFECAVSNTSINSAGLYVVAISLNGQDFVTAPDSTAVLFFEPPRFVDATPPPSTEVPSPGRMNFGAALNGIIPNWGFASAAPFSGGTPLVAFLDEPNCVPGVGNVACVMRLEPSVTCPVHASNDDSCQSRSAQPALRFIPGQCNPGEDCACDLFPGTRDAPLFYNGIQPSNRSGAPAAYTVLSATVPNPGPDGRLGVHYACFSLDGSNYVPIVPQVKVFML